MSNIVFEPWVGSKYEASLFGLRILILGESHYGVQEDERADFTIEVIKEWGQDKRSSFFTIIAKTVLNYGAGDYLSDNERAAFWENVSFYNYVQRIVGEGARIRPESEMWALSEEPLLEVIENLAPQLIIVLGKELANNIPSINEDIGVCCLSHPSSGGYSYDVNNPLLLDAIHSMKGKLSL